MFNEYTIKDVIEEVIDYRGKTPKKLGGDWSEEKTEYMALSAKNIKKGRIVQPDTIRYVDQEMYNKWMKQEVERGTILITSEAPFGELLYWDSDEKIVLSQRLFGLKIKKEFNSRYIYYYMFSEQFQGELSGRATGSTVTGLRQPELLKCHLKIPNRKYQDIIANILMNIDKKIDLNSEINNNLLELSIGKIQNTSFDNYENLSDLSEIISKGTTPTTGDMKQFENSNIKFIKVRDFTGYYINKKELEFIPKEIHEGKLKRSILKENDLLISIAGTLGKVAYVDSELDNSNTNQAVAFIRLKDILNMGYLYFYLQTKKVQMEINEKQVHAVQPNFSLGMLGQIEVPILMDDEKKKYNDILNVIKNNVHQNEKLEQLRDTLLPKLMNGEIELDNIEI